MATTFGIKRGYVNGWLIFEATYDDKNYKLAELDGLSSDITKCFDQQQAGGIFNPSTSVALKYGNTEKTFTFDALDLQNDIPGALKTKILDRFQKIMTWKSQMNEAEEFVLEF